MLKQQTKTRGWAPSYPSLAQVLALSVVALCFIWTLRLVSQPNVQLTLLQNQDDSQVQRLMRVITDQQQHIKELSEQVKGCDQIDTYNFKYPKFASDDLTGVQFGTSDGCGNTSALDAVVLVHSSASHFSRRNRYRKAHNSSIIAHKLKIVFLLGHVLDANIMIDLEIENRQYGDTVIGTFLDTYQNLTLKAVMGFRWAAEQCQQAKLIIKMDDDVLFMSDKFFDTFWYKQQKKKPSGQKRSIYCTVWENARVGRTGKWRVGKNLFANSTYQFPYCAGYFIIITTDLLAPMYKAAKTLDFFWIDDVFMYGMVPDYIGGVKFWQIGRRSYKITSSESLYYKKCKKSKSSTISNCSYWGVLLNDENQFESELNEYLTEYPNNLKLNSTKRKTDPKHSNLTAKSKSKANNKSITLIQKSKK